MSNKFKELSKALKNRSSQHEDQEAVSQVAKRGRRKGKRSDPNFEQVGIYIPRNLHLDVKRKLLDHPDKDFSDLVKELLRQWSEGFKKKNSQPTE